MADSRSRGCCTPRAPRDRDLELARQLDELHLDLPFCGARKLAAARRKRKSSPGLVVRAYHRVAPTGDPAWACEQPGMLVTPETLAMHRRVLREHFMPIHLDEWFERREGVHAWPEPMRDVLLPVLGNVPWPPSPAVLDAAVYACWPLDEEVVESGLSRVAANLGVGRDLFDWDEARGLARLTSLVEAAGLADRCHFHGFRTSTAELYRAFSAFVSSARSEGRPLSFLEAMACGIPIAATANEGSTPLLQQTNAGILAGVGNAPDLAHSILELLRNPARARAPGENGRRAACQDFSLDTTCAQYMALYGELSGVAANQSG